VTDHPIIFSAPMVWALLDGRKTQTRRLAWRDRPFSRKPSPWQRVKLSDRLWVREAWQHPAMCEPQYRATATERMGHWDPEQGPWRPSIHMPRWASRLTLTVTATKIEPLHEITEADAKAEGVDPQIMHATFGYGGTREHDYARGFAELWDRLHGPGSWNANPEVVALTFTVERRNIDAAVRRAAAE